MGVKKNLLNLSVLAMLLLFVFVACDKNEFDGVDKGKVAVQFRATNAKTTKGGGDRALVFGDMEVKSFQMNIAEIEFDFDDDVEYNGTYSSDDELELRGPFEVYLVENGMLQTQTILQVDIPKTKYDEIEFELEKSRKSNSPLYKQTVRIEGNISGTPFVFTTDREFDFEIEFDKPFVLDEKAGVIINFHINSFFGAIIAGTNLSRLDVNNDGIIMITYDDDDNKQNNYEFGKKIWNLMDDMFDCDDDNDD